MYRAYGLIAPNANVSLESLMDRLKAEFPGYAVTLRGKQITISKGYWEFELMENEGPEVLAESAELAEKLAGRDFATDLEACARRLEIWSETPDPELEHFEKYQLVVGVLKSIPGITVIEPTEPSFL
jgi:hypothetical protein